MMQRPMVDPESPGGLSLWMGYLAGKIEGIEDRQARQNGSVDRLVARVGELPCSTNADRIKRLEDADRTGDERQYGERRDRKQNLTLFAIKLFMVVAAFALGIASTRIC